MDLADLGELADKYNIAREERLAADKVAAQLASIEASLKTQIISALVASGSTAIGGKTVVLNLKPDPRWIAQDWGKIWDYIFEEKAIDLVEKRLLQTAFRERFKDNIIIPGTLKMDQYKLTLSKPKS